MRTPSGSCLLSPVAAALLLAAAPALAQVKLTNGDVLQAEIVNPDAGISAAGEPLVELDHPILGRITVPADSIAKPEEVAEAAELGTLAGAADAMGQAIDSVFFTGWSKSLAAGFNGTEGNTQTLSLYANFETGIEDERRRWAIKADYFRKTEDGDATESNLIARADRDWLIPGAAHFYFGRATFEYDQFEGFEQRVGLYGGVGYQFIDTARHSLLGRVGVGAIYEFGGNENFTTEALLGVEYAFQIAANQSFEFKNTFYPALDPFFAEYRNVTEANYKISLAAGDGLSLKLGVYNEYDSEVPDNSENNDFKYFGALVYDF